MRISTPSGRDLRDRPREDQLIFPWNSRGSGLRGLLYISSDPVTTYQGPYPTASSRQPFAMPRSLTNPARVVPRPLPERVVGTMAASGSGVQARTVRNI